MAVGLCAPLHGQSRGLVEDQHHIVLEQGQGSGEFDIISRQSIPWRRRRIRQRRHADGRPGGETGVGLDPRAVHPQLSATSKSMDLDLSKARPAAPQPAIQPHAVLGVADHQGLYLIHGRALVFPGAMRVI
jgi:hypothetical protein